MNIYDISKQSGVSIATVSRAMNNSGYVSAKTKAKIMKVIEENNYSPSAFARGMSTASMSTVGVLCSDSRDLYQASCVYQLDKELKKQGYTMMLGCTGNEIEMKQRVVRQLMSKAPDALIFIGSHYVEDKMKDYQYILEAARKIPVIILNGYLEGENIFGICCDDRQALYDLTSLVLKNGARKPLFLYRRMNDSGRRKAEGYQTACAKYSISDSPMIPVLDDLEETISSLEDLQDFDSFDSYICADDEAALAVLKVCHLKGISVPEQKQITGFNNSLIARACHPELTTYDNQTEYLCQSAVVTLMSVLENKDHPSKTTYTGKIVEKGSTLRRQQ